MKTSWAELGHTRYQLMVCPTFQRNSNLGGRLAGWLVGWLAGTLYSHYEASLWGSPLGRVWQLSSKIANTFSIVIFALFELTP